MGYIQQRAAKDVVPAFESGRLADDYYQEMYLSTSKQE
jgi:hypothetical protein